MPPVSGRIPISPAPHRPAAESCHDHLWTSWPEPGRRPVGLRAAQLRARRGRARRARRRDGPGGGRDAGDAGRRPRRGGVREAASPSTCPRSSATTAPTPETAAGEEVVRRACVGEETGAGRGASSSTGSLALARQAHEEWRAGSGGCRSVLHRQLRPRRERCETGVLDQPSLPLDDPAGRLPRGRDGGGRACRARRPPGPGLPVRRRPVVRRAAVRGVLRRPARRPLRGPGGTATRHRRRSSATWSAHHTGTTTCGGPPHNRAPATRSSPSSPGGWPDCEDSFAVDGAGLCVGDCELGPRRNRAPLAGRARRRSPGCNWRRRPAICNLGEALPERHRAAEAGGRGVLDRVVGLLEERLGPGQLLVGDPPGRVVPVASRNRRKMTGRHAGDAREVEVAQRVLHGLGDARWDAARPARRARGSCACRPSRCGRGHHHAARDVPGDPGAVVLAQEEAEVEAAAAVPAEVITLPSSRKSTWASTSTCRRPGTGPRASSAPRPRCARRRPRARTRRSTSTPAAWARRTASRTSGLVSLRDEHRVGLIISTPFAHRGPRAPRGGAVQTRTSAEHRARPAGHGEGLDRDPELEEREVRRHHHGDPVHGPREPPASSASASPLDLPTFVGNEVVALAP